MEPTQTQRNAPVAVAVEAGKTYWWCACGKSKTQPFCDGSHQGGDGAPVAWQAQKSETVYFCACKRSAAGALCDGSHLK